jgi:DDE superfamily endonuclease
LNLEDEEDAAIFICMVDGTHCRISEPSTDPSTKWFSHKSNGPGLAYELALSIYSNQVVWFSGPFTPNQHDLTIFRKPNGLKERMPVGKRGIADNGYVGEEMLSTDNDLDSEDVKRFKKRAKARQETLNARCKIFGVLSERFRHTGARRMECHGLAFSAVIVIVQYEIEGCHPLFDV